MEACESADLTSRKAVGNFDDKQERSENWPVLPEQTSISERKLFKATFIQRKESHLSINILLRRHRCHLMETQIYFS